MTYTLHHKNGAYAKGTLEGLLPDFAKILFEGKKGSINKDGVDVILAENGSASWGPGATADDKLTLLRETNICVDKEVKDPNDIERFADRVKALRQDLLCQFDSAGLPLEVPEYVTQALNSLDNAASQLRLAQYCWSRELGGRR